MTLASASEKAQEPSGEAVPFKRDYTAAREMVIRAGQYARRARDLGVFLNFSDSSVEVAEEFGRELWAKLPDGLPKDKAEDLRARLILELGAYFGETLLRNHGGRWGWAIMGGRRVFALRRSSRRTTRDTVISRTSPESSGASAEAVILTDTGVRSRKTLTAS